MYQIQLRYLYSGAWLSLVERGVRDAEVAGSNPVAPIFYDSRYFIMRKPFLCAGKSGYFYFIRLPVSLFPGRSSHLRLSSAPVVSNLPDSALREPAAQIG